MTRRLVPAAGLVAMIALATPVDAVHAQPGASAPVAGDHGAALDAALDAYDRRAWDAVIALVTPITLDPRADPRDRAEAHRMRGMAAYATGDEARAEAHFLAYLRFDPGATLDPNDPPEAKVFLDRVRADHDVELRARRPRPAPPWPYAFVPPVGQLRNGHPRKAAVIAIAGGTLAIATAGSYVMLRRWCDEGDGTCGTHTSAARSMRIVNFAAGGALAALYVYGVVDGLAHRRAYRPGPPPVMPIAFSTEDGGGLGLAGSF